MRYRFSIKQQIWPINTLNFQCILQKNLNNALMGILRVQDLRSPPYVYTQPFTMSHKVSENDLFVVLGSDGLFDFFTNDEVVQQIGRAHV